MKPFTIHPARVRGFCSGVRRALALVEATLERADARKVYLLHEIVHNTAIVSALKARGVRIVETPEEIPEQAIAVFSAHGVSRAVEAEARARRLEIVDATCPLVKRIHAKSDAVCSGALVVLIGHPGHPETIGTLGQHPGRIHLAATVEAVKLLPEPEAGRPVVVLTQTTLCADELAPVLAALRDRYGELDGAGDLCYATTDRQRAVRELCEVCQLVIVIGSKSSSNSNRLCEVARHCGRRALLVDAPEAVAPEDLADATDVGVTAGASAPEELVQQLIARLENFGGEAG